MAFAVFDQVNQDISAALFIIDLSLEEQHQFGGQVARSAVEVGADVADHVITAPRTFTFSGYLVDEDYGSPLIERSVQGFVAQANNVRGARAEQGLDPLAEVRGWKEPPSRLRAWGLVQRLGELHLAKPVVIYTDDEAIKSMILVEWSHRPAGKDAFEVAGTFEEIRFAETLARELPPVPKPAAKARSQSAKDQGTTKGTDRAANTTPPDRRTTAAMLLDLLSGGTGVPR